jgi:D-alanyl-D-alanine carboxypeptidase (penicillin-binding protein 5/6)
MKKTFLICVLLAFSLLFSGVCAPVLAVEGQGSCHGIAADYALDGSKKLLETAHSVILYEMNTDTMVYSYQPDKQVNPTGLVKLLTVLVALENGNLDDMVKVYQTTLNTVAIGSVSAGLKAEEEISLGDLLQCIMVASANDACAVVAAHIGGSQAGFVEMMNAKATALGCTGSNFTNPHGLADPAQYSTARDLAIITKAALENPLFCQMFAALEYTVPATNRAEARKLTTTNHMMRGGHANYDSRVTGGKPAAATTKDRSMICTAKIGDANYLCVVMNVKAEVSSNGMVILRYGIFEEMTSLLSYAQTGFEVRQILDDRQPMYQYAVENGQNDVFLRPARKVSVVLPVECDLSALSFDHTLHTAGCVAPIAAGQNMGRLTISYGNLILGSCDLLAVSGVPMTGTTITPANRLDVVEEAQTPLWKQVLLYGFVAALILLILFIAVYVLVRALRNGKIRAHLRRRARNRKRSR